MVSLRKRFFSIGAVLLSSLLLHASSSFADSIVAGKGPRPLKFSGKVIELKNGVVSVLEEEGTVVDIDWSEITAIDIGDPVFVTLTSDERVLGCLESENGRILIHSASLGTIELTRNDVVAIERRKRTISPESSVSSQEMGTIRGRGNHASSVEQEDQRGTEDAETKAAEAGNRVATIGEKEEKRPEETFVRGEKVHLPKGKMETEFGVSYYDSQWGPLGYRDRTLLFPFTLRYGLTDRASAFLSVPLAVGWREVPEDGKTKTYSNSGLGDISFGLQYQILNERAVQPDVMFFLQGSSNTGESGPYLARTQIPLGSGFWQINPGLSFVKTVDPVVLFGTLSYTHFFEDSGFQPGEAVNTVLGTGFAANDEVALSFRLEGSYLSRMKYQGEEIGSILTPFTFYFALDKYVTNNSYLEPAVGIGLTSDAPDFWFGLSYVYKWY